MKALDNSPPVITIAPATGTTINESTVWATVKVCDDGFVGEPTVTYNGLTLPAGYYSALPGCGSFAKHTPGAIVTSSSMVVSCAM